MKYVVVGGAGFIGSHLVEALLGQNCDVTVFDRQGAPNLRLLADKGASIALGDFNKPEGFEKVLLNTDVVFHLLSTTVPRTSNENVIYDIESNLIGTIKLFEVAKSVGVRKIVFASSGGTIYGIPLRIPITEGHPTNPISSYGITKLAIEKYAALFWELYNLDYTVLRISNAYGDRQPANGPQGLIATLLDNALKSQPIHIWGDGSVIRDYIYISDIVSAFLAAIQYKGSYKIFNIGSGVGYSVTEVMQTIETIVNKHIDVYYEPGRVFDVPSNILDNTLAMNELNWKPIVALYDGIKKIVESFYQISA